MVAITEELINSHNVGLVAAMIGDKGHDIVKKINEVKALGFMARSYAHRAGCNTIPCYCGKSPYESRPTIACGVIGSMCSISPVEQVKDIVE